jgi:predicted  nucleic acid-binding Zn-ribbon protein
MVHLKKNTRLVGLTSGLAMLALVTTAFAQEASGPPAGVQGGPPSEEAIAGFQKQFGAAPTDFSQAGPPPFEAPGDIPAEAKQYLSDQEIVAIACAYTQWKTGEFFSAMEALKTNLIPAVVKLNAAGLTIPVPNVDNVIAEGHRRVDEACQSSNYDQARSRIMDFDAWGRTAVQADFDKMRDAMQVQMESLGTGVKEKVQAAVATLVEEGKTDIQTQMEAYASAEAEAAAQSQSPMSQEAFEAKMNAKAGQLAAALQAKIEAKAKETVGAALGPLQEVTGLMEGMQEKIQASIESGKANYESYHQQAIALRKASILKVVDASLVTAMTKLDEASAAMDAARATDPQVPVVADIKASLKADRDAMAAAIDAALAADDEAAVQAAVDAFRAKWQEIQRQMEEHAGAAVGQICAVATSQFGPARAKYSSSISQIAAIEAMCKGSISDDCQMVAPFRDNLGLLTQKLTALNTEMKMAETLCSKASAADRVTLIAILGKIKSDGEDAQNLGVALEIEKRNKITTTVQQACDVALPQLTQANSDLQTEDLAVLKANFEGCANSATAVCKAVNKLKPKFNDFQSRVAAFSQQVDKVRALCAAPGADDSLEAIESALSVVDDQASILQESGAALKADQAEKDSAAAYCLSMGTQLDFMRQDALKNVDEMDTMTAECAGVKNDEYCKKVQSMGNETNALKTRTKNLLAKMDTLDAKCAKPDVKAPAADVVALANAIETEASKLKADVDALGLKVEKNARGAGIWIEAENEAKADVRPVAQRPASNLKETNPSWRPPYFGTGDWYLAVGGENLQYNFKAPKAAKYFVWVRDYVDRFQPVGVRRITIAFNGKTMGTYPEAPLGKSGDRGKFGWHMVGSVDLAAGAQTMKVTKESTTSGAAILDAYYLTTGPEAPPEK